MKVYKNEKNVRQKKTLCDLNLLFFASQDMNQSMLAYPTNPTNFKKKKDGTQNVVPWTPIM